MKGSFNINDGELLKKMIALQNQEPDAFYDLIYEAIAEDPSRAIDEGSIAEKKIKALDKMIDHYLEREEYERCALLHDLKKKIQDAEG
jgi:hypothetical protein